MTVNYDYDQLFPGRFIKAGEFQGRERTLTITNIEMEEMDDQKGKKMKCIVSFGGEKKQLVLNRTNGECLKGMFGRKVADWIGKRVTFFPATVDAFGAPTLAIRVRGSPDLQADKEISCKLGRRGDVKVKMKKTGQAPAQQQQRAAPKPVPAPAPPPESEADTDGPPDDLVLPGQDDYPGAVSA